MVQEDLLCWWIDAVESGISGGGQGGIDQGRGEEGREGRGERERQLSGVCVYVLTPPPLPNLSVA